MIPDAPVPDAPSVASPNAGRLAAEPATACLNCGAVLPGEFCPDCGQRDQPLRLPAHQFISESVSEYFGLDGRLWRSLGLLLFRPGALTVAYLDGRRARYLRPLRLYLTATVLFFFLLSLQDPFKVETETMIVEPLAGDSLQTVQVLDDAIRERIDAAEAEQAAILAATNALVQVGRDPLVTLSDSAQAFADTLDAVHDRLDAMPDDSLIAVSSLPETVQASLRDSSVIEVPTTINQIIGDGMMDDLPEWAKGDLARQYQETESPSEQHLLGAQVQRAVLRQIPTTLFVVLPVFALLLKGLYLFGMGRSPRRRPRPVAPSGDRAWRKWAYRVRLWRWRWQQWRAHRRVRRRRRGLTTARQRRVRGWLRRARHRVARHARLRPWRVRTIRQLRRSLRMQRNPYYAEHLVFALHVHAYAFVVFVALLLASTASAPEWIRTALILTIPLYFLLAQKRVYGQPWGTTISKAAALGLSYVIVLSLGVLLAGGLALRLG